MDFLLKILKREPAILAGAAGVISWAVLQGLDVVEASGGEWATILATLLGAAGITRQRVSPVD